MTKFIRLLSSLLVLVAIASACKPKDNTPQVSRQVELAPAGGGQPQLADTARTASGTASPLGDLDAAPTPAATGDVLGAEAPKAEPKPQRQPTRQPTSPPTPRPSRQPATSSGGGDFGAAPTAAPAVAPAPVAPPAPTTGTIAGGSSLSASMGTRICTNTHRAGDRVSATLASPVSGTNGAQIPAGATVTLRVTESVRGENGKDGIRLAFEPVSVSYGGATYSISGNASVGNLETVRAQTTGDQAKKVAAGAAVGALAGQLLGKKTKSTVIGAAVGAAAGGAVAAGTSDWNGCLSEGGRVTVTLSGPVTVQLSP